MRPERTSRAIGGSALVFILWSLAVVFADAPDAGPEHFVTKRRVAPSLEPILRHLAPGTDGFPEEKDAEELAARLEEMGALLRESPDHVREATERLLAPEFRGGRLSQGPPLEGRSAFEVVRAKAISQDLVRDRASFATELRDLVAGFRTVRVAEFLITSLVVRPGEPRDASTAVRYDLVGTGRESGSAERMGRWRIDWRRGTDGVWRIAKWTALADVASHAAAPVFSEVTEGALGGNPSFHLQLVPGLDAWVAELDGVFAAGGMGHHGVSAGDVDGDGLDDLYVSQPAGLPNRLFRNKGDGTFLDITETAGLAVLDHTSQSLFADVDNDGDQDLIVVTGTGLLLFVSDGQGHFTRAPDAFQWKGALRGSPTSIAMADYDRDGFLDLYVCTYAYVIGASEDKSGPPNPYHDAQNGPPNVLLRNDGRGHFVDVTDDALLRENNDRFSFAAAWGDYDEDGWPDLVVANDFGRKNLFHNEGLKGGRVVFTEVTAQAGVEDYGAGMSATWLDYDNDGHLDLYFGNMWTSTGQRVTSLPGFMPDAPLEVREIYRRHARGNSLFRNRGDGTFEDVSLSAGAEMGRWAWSSDAIDFDNDGFEDLYVVNGMFTRDPAAKDVYLDSFFWRQVTARSPLTRITGTLFDDAWRATSRLLLENGSQARHERNTLLRNDGHGRYDEVAGTAGLDLDQDGRSFAVLDLDQDGDPDLALMAPRSSPQLRLFRNDLAGKNASVALRLVGTKSNRDAIGARVTVETETLRCTKTVLAGSGFISQHSKELLFGLGRSTRIVKTTIQWPSGLVQVLTDLPLGQRIRIEEGGAPQAEPFRPRSVPETTVVHAPGRAQPPAQPPSGERPPGETWLNEPFPAPDFNVRDLAGQEHSKAGLRGHPAVVLFWSAASPASRAALLDLAQKRGALAKAGASVLAVATGPATDESKVQAAARGLEMPVALAGEDMAGTYSIASRFLFDRREDLRLPTAFLLDAEGQIVKLYRDRIMAAHVVEDVPKIDATPAALLARAVPFPGVFYAPPSPRNEFQYSLDLAEQGYDAAALAAFQRAANRDPGPITFYNLATLYMRGGRPAEARKALERALELKPGYPEARNSLGALLAQSGDVPGAVFQFRTALEAKPEYADALNNLGYTLFQAGQDQEAYDLYQRALLSQPVFPEVFNNLGIFFGQTGDLEKAETWFRKAVETRPAYGEAANNLALVLGARGDPGGAIAVLKQLLQDDPAFEMGYVGLVRIYAGTGQTREALKVLELLLQRNPTHATGLELSRELRAGER